MTKLYVSAAGRSRATAANPQAAYEDIAGNRANLPLTAANDEQPLVARGSLAVNIARGEGKSWTTRVFTDARSGKSYETYTWGNKVNEPSRKISWSWGS